MAIPTRLHFPRAPRRLPAACTLLGALALLPATHGATAGAAPLDAAASDPGALGWMQGFPPPEAKRIRYTDSDYFAFPKLRWTACHFRQLMPTVGVSRGPGQRRRCHSAWMRRSTRCRSRP